MNKFERKNAELVTEFDRFIIENPQYADAIPDGALVVMQLEDDHEFNEWSRRTAAAQAQKGQKIIYVRIKKLQARPFEY
jgi:hypothetical protein